jgi:hypothetical protein
MTRFLVAWFVLGLSLAALWVGAIELLSRAAGRRPLPTSFIMFHQPSTSSAEAECLRALEELWSLDSAGGED